MNSTSEPDLLRPVAVEPRDGYRIWLRYADGTEGEVDLSHLVGLGVFRAWEDPTFFERVHLDDFGSIAWSEELDMCPDALYMELTGKTPDQIWPGLRAARESADSGSPPARRPPQPSPRPGLPDGWRRSSDPIRPLQVEPRATFRIWLQFADGAEGEVDLSDLVGKGLFKAWMTPGAFDQVHLTDGYTIAWGNEIELCPDALYLEVTGKSAADICPGLTYPVANA